MPAKDAQMFTGQKRGRSISEVLLDIILDCTNLELGATATVGRGSILVVAGGAFVERQGQNQSDRLRLH